MTKEEIQQKVYKDLRDEPNIVLKWATGIGKSKELVRNFEKETNILINPEKQLKKEEREKAWDLEL